jgi:hypothetical protein
MLLCDLTGFFNLYSSPLSSDDSLEPPLDDEVDSVLPDDGDLLVESTLVLVRGDEPFSDGPFGRLAPSTSST